VISRKEGERTWAPSKITILPPWRIIKSRPEPSPAWVMSTGLESPVTTGSALIVTAPHKAAANKNIDPEREAVKIVVFANFRPINLIDKSPRFIFTY
jgi:hypothetical protein